MRVTLGSRKSKATIQCNCRKLQNPQFHSSLLFSGIPYNFEARHCSVVTVNELVCFMDSFQVRFATVPILEYGKTFKWLTLITMNRAQIEGDLKMKKKILAILAVIAIFSMCFAGTVSAAKEGYGFTIGPGTVAATIDGTVGAGEWDTDSYKDFLYNGWTMGPSFFRDKWGTTPAICEVWLMEFLGDTTNDAGDWWEICVDTTATGGATPQAADFKVNWSAAQGVKVWAGTGTSWAVSAAVVGTDVVASTSISASPASATPHRIVEIYLDKGVSAANALAMGLSNNARIAVHDAGTGQTVMWPPYSSANEPNTYGTGTTVFGDSIPEGLTIGVMLSLSTIAAIVSTRYFKKPKI